MPVDAARVKALFVAALDLPDAPARAAFLAAECGPDADLRQRVERLLSAHAEAASEAGPVFTSPHRGEVAELLRNSAGRGLPETAPPDPADPPSVTTDHHPAPDEGTVIGGKYKLLQQIGEGGMGAVWMAEQLHPVRRKVAVKLVKEGMDSRRVLARFEAERQALALMDHPHIAKVLDAGATDRGSPYFVMELVKGVPLTRYCDDHRLTVPQRLELFQQICSAVQHAHQKGIIHRDLKPGNVLVESHDGRPVPKVIDFGLAKAVSELPLTDKSLFTAFGAVMGTPQYMAPEQASFSAVDVDTRADVYALGVILYELLTGSPPIGKDRLRAAALDEVLRVIREEEPPTPSARLSTAEGVPSVAANRQTEPKKLGRLVRGELDWIVMKALAKDRGRRYETATGFGADVGRYLAGEPVLAVPPSAGYRLRTFVRRNRAAVTATALVLVAVLTGAAAATWQAVRATAAERAARESAVRADSERVNADAARQVADVQREKAEWQAISARIDLDRSGWTEANNQGRSRWQVAEEEREALAQITGVEVAPRKVFIDQHTDSRRGPAILHLAATHRVIPDHARDLREYAAMAVLAWGQQFAPLIPELTHGGREVTNLRIGPDGRTILTGDAAGGVRLWDAPTGRLHAILRRSGERVVYAGFSNDGRTVVSDDEDGVLRLWDGSAGTYRAELPARADRVIRNRRMRTSWGTHPVECDGDRVLTYKKHPKYLQVTGPFELWDAKTGGLVARLDLSGVRPRAIEFVGGGKWIAVSVRRVGPRPEAASTAQSDVENTRQTQSERIELFSAVDGQWLARLDGAAVISAVSPTGSRLVTAGWQDDERPRVWDTATWRPDPPALSIRGRRPINYLSDDLFMYGTYDPISNLPEGTKSGLYQHGQRGPEVLIEYDPAGRITRVGDIVCDDRGSLFDLRSSQRLVVPPGRRYHPALARFAPDGRVMAFSAWSSIGPFDTRTDKPLDIQQDDEQGHRTDAYFPAFGFVNVKDGVCGVVVTLIRTTNLDFPRDLLELWAQVAVRGELGPGGEFVKWKEDEWERKRQALAARPAPYPDFPFPGHVATDRLHWLRREWAEAADADKPRLAADLLHRAELLGDAAEATRWRLELDRLGPHLAPPPRPAARP